MGSAFSICHPAVDWYDGANDEGETRVHRPRSLYEACLEGNRADVIEGTDAPSRSLPSQGRGERAERLMRKLFRLHDLNGNGLLEEVELVKLNEKVAMLHSGADTDRAGVRQRYSNVFRDNLNREGKPVTYTVFREYMFKILDGLDPDMPTQAMIIDHLIAEADLALMTYPASLKIRCGSLSRLPEQRYDHHRYGHHSHVSLAGG